MVGGRQTTPARSNDRGDAVSASVLLVLAVSCRWDRPSFAVEQKPSKDDRNEKLNTFLQIESRKGF